ncbi:hypothetical protein EGI22_15900 [Lacihabitans sp. LS3-19]|nr:hypothetical protein [Lacihabitans sp. LS3-19]
MGKIKFVADICFINSEQIFQLALSLIETWYVSKVEFLEREVQKELHLTIDYKAGFLIDKTGKSTVRGRVERKWRHQIFFSISVICIVKSHELKRLKIMLNKHQFHGHAKVVDLLFEAFS